MIEDYFKTTAIHCEGDCDLTADATNNLYTVGSDDLIYCKDLLTKVETRMDLKAEAGSYSTIAAHPKDKHMLAIGGLNKEVEIIKFNDSSKPVPVFKTVGPIQSVVFSKSGRYLAIATEEPTAILYNYDRKSFVKCRPGHSGSICSVFFSPDQRYVCSTGTDAMLKVFKIEQDSECTLTASYEVTSAASIDNFQRLRGCFNVKSTMIAMPGKPALQQVNIEPNKMYLTLNSSIKHSTDIAICHWQNSEVLVTSSLDKETSLWKYHNGEKIASVTDLLPTRIITVEDRFYCIDNGGTLYEFYKISLIKSEMDLLEALENQSEKAVEEKEEAVEPANLSEQQEEEQSYVEIKKPTKSKADKIVSCMPQAPIHRGTSFFSNNRFLYCSEFGAMIQRLQGQSQSIEMESFVGTAAAEPKRKNLFINRELKHFAIGQNVVAYADDSTFGIIGEDSWEVKLQSIVGVAVGNDWVAAATEESIKVFDFGGNELRDIAMDKKLVSLAGYQNLLAFVYHDTLPMWGCQSLRMQVFIIDSSSHPELICSSIVPIKLVSILKTFGFSYEGMLYSADSKGAVRIYNFNKSQWSTVYDPESSEERYWLVGIRNYEMYMYKLEDDLEPTVLPRSPLVALPLELQTINKSPLYENKSSKKNYGQYLWKLHQLEHEKFRHQMWYKYRVSRDPTNPLYHLSSKISSLEDIKKVEAGSQMDFMFLIRNMIANNEADKACMTVKTFVRSSNTAQKLVQIFEEAGMRELAIKIETHFEEKERQVKYEAIQQERLLDLKTEIQKNLSLRPVNPMQRAANPMSQSTTISRTQTNMYSGLSKPTPINELPRVEEEKNQAKAINPFAKSSTNLSDKIKKDFDLRIEKNIQPPPKNGKLDKKKPEL